MTVERQTTPSPRVDKEIGFVCSQFPALLPQSKNRGDEKWSSVVFPINQLESFPVKPPIVDRPEVTRAFLKEVMRVKSGFPLLAAVTGRDNTYSGNERKRLQMSVAALIIKRFPLRS
ncbi:hypothetical protein CDAR_539091 [Caerostris darwini]|uniref:Uncharacterized protein n=1 Tax=Caerostris darwini TaxID=1538125 RepID=A0AAV4T6J8_9ARAC|nr:hypothetical protein CDAR_539091 [Caerostris darwini]